MTQLIRHGREGWERTLSGGARVTCKQCGVNNFVAATDIYADGIVTERFNCISKPCSYQDFIKLDGWNEL